MLFREAEDHWCDKTWRWSVCQVSQSSLSLFTNVWSTYVRGRTNEDTWQQHCWRDHVSQMLTRFAMRTTFVVDTNIVSWTQCVCKSSEMFLVSPWCAIMLQHFATDGQDRKTQCFRQNVPSFCQCFRVMVTLLSCIQKCTFEVIYFNVLRICSLT